MEDWGSYEVPEQKSGVTLFDYVPWQREESGKVIRRPDDPPLEQFLNVYKQFLADGHEFSVDARSPKGESSELMDMMATCGRKGMDLFLHNGGKTNSGVVNNKGWTEMMVAAAYLDTDSFERFVKRRDTQFNHLAQNDDGWTELMFIVSRHGLKGLEIFTDHRGRFNADARTVEDGYTEAMMIVADTGKDGFDLYLTHRGEYIDYSKDNEGNRSRDYIKHYIGEDFHWELYTESKEKQYRENLRRERCFELKEQRAIVLAARAERDAHSKLDEFMTGLHDAIDQSVGDSISSLVPFSYSKPNTP